ncbi:MAG: response regulator, partial [Dehalococcoidia bacterium]|nr:response regulator [Dehalococcoidia bacterium]
VTGVQSAAAAIEALGNGTFDLVLLDLNLLDGDGMRVVDAMQQAPRDDTPVVLMTGEQVLDAGDPRISRVAGVLPKPFEIDDLEQTVRRFSA